MIDVIIIYLKKQMFIEAFEEGKCWLCSSLPSNKSEDTDVVCLNAYTHTLRGQKQTRDCIAILQVKCIVTALPMDGQTHLFRMKTHVTTLSMRHSTLRLVDSNIHTVHVVYPI